MMPSSLAEDLVCPICLALFQEPHMLGCGHNFCLPCLQGAIPGGQDAEATCPECRSPFRLRELKRNRALGNVAGKVRRWGGEWGAPETRWHFCEEHDEPLKLFCTQDQRPICVICRDTPGHRGHDFMPTRDAVQVAQGKLKEYLTELEKHQVEQSEDEADQMKEIKVLKKCTEDLLAHVSEEFEVLHQILRQKEQDIKLTIEMMKKENMDEMEDFLAILKEQASLNTEAIANGKAALDTTDHIAFLKGFKKLMKNVEQHHQIEMEDLNEAEEEGLEESEDEDFAESEDEDFAETEEEDLEEAEEEDLEGAEEKPDQDDSCEEQCKGSDCEDDDDSESDLDDDDGFVPVDLALENFAESLDFRTWKEMLEDIKPRQGC